ncbi:MAG: DUF5343 domain-containing protein [Pararhodobacter sp.]|nr:DUF5343 domain-containing protein [Pararhodobacter sp.]
MGLTTNYLVAVNRLEDLLKSLQNAEAPDKFTQKFLEDLGFRSTNDRLFIGVLQGLGFLDGNRAPTNRYFEYLDREIADSVLADGIRDAYEDLFRVKKDAHKMSQSQVKNKLRSLLQGKVSDTVLSNMAKTFTHLVKHADFETPVSRRDGSVDPHDQASESDDIGQQELEVLSTKVDARPRASDGMALNYRIEIALPPTRDRAVYDAIFKSIKEHLL